MSNTTSAMTVREGDFCLVRVTRLGPPPNASVRGISPDCAVTIVSIQWLG